MLTEAVAAGAVCLDGSAPAFHWRDGHGAGAKSWIIFLEGGGWCAGFDRELPVFDGWGMDSCYSRSRGPLGSGLAGPATIYSNMTEGSSWLSNDPAVNPRFCKRRAHWQHML